MPNDWIPARDEDFDNLADQFVGWVTATGNATLAGFSPAETTALTTAGTAWDDAFQAKKDYDNQGESITLFKQQAREELTAKMRPMAEQMRGKNKMGSLPAAELLLAGVPVADTTPSAPPVPTTRPVLTIDAGQRLQHIYHWRDEGTPTSKARPAGVKHLELRIATTAAGASAPADPDAYPHVATDPATPHLLAFDAADGAKTAHVLGRWVNTAGEPGPWSTPVNATVLA